MDENGIMHVVDRLQGGLYILELNIQGMQMSLNSDIGSQPHDEGRVLRGYRRRGKRFTPPFLQYMNVEESKWIDHRVPELVWVALLMHVFGVKDGTEMATRIAEVTANCVGTNEKAFAAASDYVELSAAQKRGIRSALNAEGILDVASQGLAALIRHYREFPLGFLAEPNDTGKVSSGSTLEDLRVVVSDISDRHGYAGTLAQATVVYIYCVNNKLRVARGLRLANLEAIVEYPMTDESRKVAASARATATFLLGQIAGSDWQTSFWDQGRAHGPCEVA